MTNRIKEKLQNLYKKSKESIGKRVTKYGEKANWGSLATILIGYITLDAYRSIGPAVAEYQGKKLLYTFSNIITVLLIIAAIWEFLCLMSDMRIGGVIRRIPEWGRKLWTRFRACPPKTKWIFSTAVVVVFIGGALGWKFLYHDWHTTECYTSIVEIYGLPQGMGEPLSEEEQDQQAGYWRIEEYPNQHRVILTYVESYQQLEIMREYSSAYYMQLFQTPARIEYTYDVNPDRFHAYGQDSFVSAEENGYRDPLAVSYYGSNDKLLLQLNRENGDTFAVKGYASGEQPQLWNSTLLRIPDGQEAGNGFASQRIETMYNADGLPEARRLNQGTSNLYGVNGERYTYDNNRQLTSLCYLDGNGIPVCNKIGVMLITFKYDNEGNLSSIRYYRDENGTEKTEGFYGVFCEKFSYDPFHNLTERRQLDRTENWSYDNNGVYRYEYLYSGNTLQEELYWGLNETAAWSKQCNSHVLGFETGLKDGKKYLSVSFNAAGIPEGTGSPNRVTAVPSLPDMIAGSRAFRFGSSVQEAASGSVLDRSVDSGSSAGSDSILEKTDDSGSGAGESDSILEKTADPGSGAEESGSILGKTADLGSSERESGSILGGTAGLGSSAGESGSILERTAGLGSGAGESDSGLTEREDRARADRKYASILYIFGDSSMEMKYYDDNGILVLNEHGYAVKKTEYDGRGRVVLESYADEGGSPCYINGGYTAVRRVYVNNSDDRIARLKYLDIKGNLVFNTEEGYAWVSYEYIPQDRGEKITRIYYDAEGKPCYILNKGYAMVEDLYNENGFLIQELYKNAEGAVTCRRDYMVAEILYEYADDGNLILERYKDAQGQPANRADTGYAVVYQEFESGRLSRKRYEGYRDQVLCPVLDRTTGIASVTYCYEGGQKKEEHYFDTEGKPVLRRETGCASITYEYSGNGQLLAEFYFGTDGRPILRSDTGCAIVRFEYDSTGRRTACRYYGVEGEAVVNTKYHCAGMDYVYGERGYRSEIRYIGLDGGLMNRDDYGIAVLCEKYDDFGNLAGESYYDKGEDPAIRKDIGYAAYEDTYENGRLVERRYLDTQGNLTLCKDGGYAVLIYEYDAYGRRTASRFLGEDGEPVISSKYHCAQIDDRQDERGRTVRLSYRGLDGELLNRTDYGIAEICRIYDNYGDIVYETYYDADGLPGVRKEYGYASYQNTYENGRIVEQRYYDAEGDLVLRKDTGYAMEEYIYDEYGQRSSIRYYGIEEEPVISKSVCCAGFEYDYDQMGNTTQVRYIGMDGLPMNRRDGGVAKVCYQYDSLGNLTNEQYFDVGNNPAIWKNYFMSSYEDVYENGKVIETRYLDMEGNLILRDDIGYAVVKMEYDQNGRIAAEYYFDTSGMPVISTKYHCAGMTYSYDSKGNREKICYLGLDGEAMNRDDYGCVFIRQEYDDWGNLTGEAYLDAGGNPVVRKEYGYASYHSTYVNGKRVETRYFDTSGNLTLRQDYGYAVDKSNYDEYGREVSWLLYDENENPVISSKYGCAGFEYEYDEKNNQTETRYVGLDGELMNRRDCGVARVCKEYDVFGNLTGEAYYDVDNYPTVWGQNGYASYQSTYENGLWIESQYFDLYGDLIQCKDGGYAMIRLEYDPFGQRVGEYYYGIGGQPVLHTTFHCAGIENKYDEKGNQIETCYLGLDGEFIDKKDSGIARICRKYDAYGRLLGESYYDTVGQPVAYRGKDYASYQNSYENGKLAETRYYGIDGKLTQQKETGVAIVRYQYDEFGRTSVFAYYGIEEQPVIHSVYRCSSVGYTYDEKGNLTIKQYMGTDGSLMIRDDCGAAQIQQEYDAYGNLTREICYDTGGNLVLRNDYGYAVCQRDYENGRLVKIQYFDTEGDLIARKDTGYAMVCYDYNEYGQTNSRWYYDDEGQLVISPEDHYAGLCYGYDNRGNCTDCWYMDQDGQSSAREEIGADVRFWEYDEYGSLAWEAYFIVNDGEWELAVPKGYDYAGIEYYYDAYENWIGRRYYDTEGNTVICSETGYAIYERWYNENGQLAAEIYYDENEEFINSVNGYAVIEYIYDASGNITDWKYYDQSEAGEMLENIGVITYQYGW